MRTQYTIRYIQGVKASPFIEREVPSFIERVIKILRDEDYMINPEILIEVSQVKLKVMFSFSHDKWAGWPQDLDYAIFINKLSLQSKVQLNHSQGYAQYLCGDIMGKCTEKFQAFDPNEPEMM